jgi:hypothetical protein
MEASGGGGGGPGSPPPTRRAPSECSALSGSQRPLANGESSIDRSSIYPPHYGPAVCVGTGEFRNSFLFPILWFRLWHRNRINPPDRFLDTHLKKQPTRMARARKNQAVRANQVRASTEVSLRRGRARVGPHRDFGSAFRWDPIDLMGTVSRRLPQVIRKITDDLLGAPTGAYAMVPSTTRRAVDRPTAFAHRPRIRRESVWRGSARFPGVSRGSVTTQECSAWHLMRSNSTTVESYRSSPAGSADSSMAAREIVELRLPG